MLVENNCNLIVGEIFPTYTIITEKSLDKDIYYAVFYLCCGA